MRGLIKKPLMCCAIIVSSYLWIGWTNPSSPKQRNTKDLAAAMEKLDLIEGKANRPYRIISPLWVQDSDGKKACDAIKVQAYKLDADAIVEFKMGITSMSQSGSFSMGLLDPGTSVSNVITVPYCSGKAVKWR